MDNNFEMLNKRKEGAKTLDAGIGIAYTLKPITLSITTRAIGFGLSHLSFIAASCDEIAVPSVYAQYRVFLAVLEAKLANLQHAYPIVARNTELAYNYRVSADLLRVTQSVVVAPEPIRRVINAVGIVQYGGGIYIPTVARDTVDDCGRFIPRAETILYSNLRRTIEALADANTPVRYRRIFEENNPIPGAIWNNHVLVNADEIMPANHNIDNLCNDIAQLGPYLNRLQKRIPKMVEGTIDFKSSGKLSAFVCNKMSNLKIPSREVGEDLQTYYRRAYPSGNIKEYYSYAKLTEAECLEGQINLLGELPRFDNLHYPLFFMRTEHGRRYPLPTDYMGVAQILYAL